MNNRFSKTTLQTATVILLLFAVAGLSTLAKTSQYFPKSHSAHYVNISNKMKAAPPVALEQVPLYPIARVVPPQTRTPKIHAVEEIPIPSPSIGVTASIQQRSPPSLFSLSKCVLWL